MSFEDRRSPDYHPQYMREPSIRPSNHQIGTPWFWLNPLVMVAALVLVAVTAWDDPARHLHAVARWRTPLTDSERAENAEARVAELETAIQGLFNAVSPMPFEKDHDRANKAVRDLHAVYRKDRDPPEWAS